MNRKLCMVIAAGLIASLSLLVVGCEMCCNSSKGSGSMLITDAATNTTHKATFSYRVECVGSYEDPAINPAAVRKVSGRLEYQDHGLWKNEHKNVLRVAFHASIDNVVNTSEAVDYLIAAGLNGDNYYDFLPPVNLDDPAQTEIYCSKTAPNLAIFRGHYTPQPKTAGVEGGVVTVMVMDNGKPGPSAEDRFEVVLTGGVFDGYRQRGVLAGGDIKAL